MTASSVLLQGRKSIRLASSSTASTFHSRSSHDTLPSFPGRQAYDSVDGGYTLDSGSSKQLVVDVLSCSASALQPGQSLMQLQTVWTIIIHEPTAV